MQIGPQAPQEGFPGFPRIDGLRFAESGGILRGRCRVAGFSRLQDLLSSNGGELEYELAGTRDEVGRAAIGVRIGGELQLTCQRCLKAMHYRLSVDDLLILARSEAEIEALPLDPEMHDRVVAGKEMEVGTMLEDEILLAIPFAPRHEHCSGTGVEEGGAQASPFADLRGLLNRGSRTRN